MDNLPDLPLRHRAVDEHKPVLDPMGALWLVERLYPTNILGYVQAAAGGNTQGLQELLHQKVGEARMLRMIITHCAGSEVADTLLGKEQEEGAI